MKSEVDDWLSELPPLDGAEEEPAAEDGFSDDLLPGVEDDNSLDDAESDDLDVDDGVDVTDDESRGGEDDERWEADVGEPELDLTEDTLGDGDGEAPGVSENDDDIDDDLPPSADDSGEEGTNDAIDQAIDEDLPALDADDEGDFEDALLLETGLTEPMPEGPRWAAESWERLPSADRALSFAVPDDDAIAGTAICVAPETLVAVTVAGRLLFDGGSVDSTGGRRLPAALTGGKAGAPLIALAERGSSPSLWVGNRSGALAQSPDLGRSWSPAIELGKPIVALAAQRDGSIVALVDNAGALEAATWRSGGTWSARAVTSEGAPLRLVAGGQPWIAVAESAIAIGHSSGVWLSRSGEDFVRVANLLGTTAGAFVGATPDAPLVIAETAADVEELVRLLRVTREGKVEILADLAPPDLDDGTDVASVVALAWDEGANALRVVFSQAICSVAPRAKG
ncbi:MAG: hypothetical protein ABW133_09050 [Polyangiaceae bacterium]